MIVFVILPPKADMFNQRFMHDFQSDVRTIYIVPDSISQEWWEERPWCELVMYENYDLRQIRQTILDEFEDEDVHVVTRWDVALSRRLPRIHRLSACTKNDIDALCHWLQETGADEHHGSISLRDRNKQEVAYKKLVAAPSLLNFYRPYALGDYNFLDAPATLLDHDLTLHLLSKGLRNVVNYEFACRGTVIKKPVVEVQDALLLERRYPGMVEAIMEPTSVVCQWRKAYDSGL